MEIKRKLGMVALAVWIDTARRSAMSVIRDDTIEKQGNASVYRCNEIVRSIYSEFQFVGEFVDHIGFIVSLKEINDGLTNGRYCLTTNDFNSSSTFNSY